MVFDGALIHVAGGGKGSFNHRFAQTTRHPSHLEDQQYPADFFPFATTPARDPVTGATRRRARARARRGALPRMFYTMTSTEYWTRAASLLHTDVAGTSDLPLDPSTRALLLRRRPARQLALRRARPLQNCGNPLDHRPPMRALLLALDAWATDGASRRRASIPRLADGTLGSVEDYRRAFPASPGLPCRAATCSRRGSTSGRASRAKASPTSSRRPSARRTSPACRCPMPTATTGAASACPR